MIDYETCFITLRFPYHSIRTSNLFGIMKQTNTECLCILKYNLTNESWEEHRLPLNEVLNQELQKMIHLIIYGDKLFIVHIWNIFFFSIFLPSKHLMLVFVPSQNQIRDVMFIEERHFVTTNPFFLLINKDIKKYIQKLRFRYRLA